MNEERKIETEEVERRRPPPRARVTPEFERKRDYLAGFLAGDKPAEPNGGPGGDLQAAVVDALKSIYDPEIPVNIYDLGLIYDVDDQRGWRRHDQDDADHAALPGRGIDAGRGRAAGRCRCPASATPSRELVWDPPWDPSKMSDEARLELGML